MLELRCLGNNSRSSHTTTITTFKCHQNRISKTGDSDIDCFVPLTLQILHPKNMQPYRFFFLIVIVSPRHFVTPLSFCNLKHLPPARASEENDQSDTSVSFCFPTSKVRSFSPSVNCEAKKCRINRESLKKRKKRNRLEDTTVSIGPQNRCASIILTTVT